MTPLNIQDKIELRQGTLLVELPKGTHKSLQPSWLQRFRGYGADKTISLQTKVVAVATHIKEYNDNLDKPVLVPLTEFSIGDAVYISLYLGAEDILFFEGNEYTSLRPSQISFKLL